MAVEIRMPQLSDTMEKGTLVAWHVEEGDVIERGDILAEIETDKANMELEAFDEGVLLKKLVEEGEQAPTQALIAVVGEEGEDISDLLEGGEAPGEIKGTEGEPPPERAREEESEEGGGAPEGDESPGEIKDSEAETAREDETEADVTPTGAEPPEPPESPPAGTAEPQEAEEETDETPAEAESSSPTPPGSPAPQEPVNGRVRATPVARQMAARHGVDLRAVEGSGPQGRVMKRDVERALREGVLRPRGDEAAGEAAAPGDVPAPTGEKRASPLSEEKQELTGMRETIARRMTEAWQNVPHFNLQQELDVEPALSALEDLNADRGEDSIPYTINDLLLMAVSRALCQEPRMNASFEEDHIRRYGQVDLAFAVAVEDGLFTPVIREAETLPLESIHARSRELIDKARAGNMMPDDYQGGTFTLTNLGMFDVVNFSAVINPPQAGILAVGAVREVPVAEDGMVGVGQRMQVTLGCDHRAVDGVIGARFLQAFKALMERPIRLFQ